MAWSIHSTGCDERLAINLRLVLMSPDSAGSAVIPLCWVVRNHAEWVDKGMMLRHLGKSPKIHPTAYVAPNATSCGDVIIGPGCRIATVVAAYHVEAR